MIPGRLNPPATVHKNTPRRMKTFHPPVFFADPTTMTKDDGKRHDIIYEAQITPHKGGIVMAVNLNRLSGLNSGLDTDSIVQNLMKVQQMKYDKIYQNKVKAEWKRDAYTEVNNLLRKFKDEYASFLSTKNNMLSSATYKNFTVTASEAGVANVTANATAQAGSYTLEVSQLATGSKMTGAGVTASGTGLTTTTVNNTALESIAGLTAGKIDSGEIKFSINGKDFTFQSTDTLRKMMDTVNASDAGVTMKYTQLGDKLTIESKVMGAYDPSLTEPTKPTYDFVYSGAVALPDAMEEPAEGTTQAEKDAYTQYQQEFKAYQDAHSAERTAYDKAHGELVKQYNIDKSAYDTNAQRSLNVTDTSGVLGKLGMNGATVQQGRDAHVKINGEDVVRSTNNFEVDGVTFALQRETTAPVNYTVARDVESSVAAVKNLVTAYNSLIDGLYGKVTEKKNYSYVPLTDDQKKDLKETEIALWEAKAKSGLLRRDSALDSLINTARRAFSDAVGDYGTLEKIGISSSVYKYQSASTIEIDEAKLRAALESDPDKVMKLFTNRVEKEDGTLDTQKSGLMYRLTSAFDSFTSTTKDVNLKLLGETISKYESSMKTELNRLSTQQERYYKQFTAMETALAKMQSQSSSLTGMLSGS